MSINQVAKGACALPANTTQGLPTLNCIVARCTTLNAISKAAPITSQRNKTMTEIIITCSTPRDMENLIESIIRGAAASKNRLEELPEKLKEENKNGGTVF